MFFEFGIKDIIDILLVAMILYYIYRLMRESRSLNVYGAYIREKTSQRVTRYDVNGNVISTTDDTHVDGAFLPSDNGEFPALSLQMKICSTQDGTYLGWGTYNMSTVAEPRTCEVIRAAGQNTYAIKMNGTMPANRTGSYVYSSSGGRFSGNEATLKIYIYKVEDASDTQYKLTRDVTPESGGHYVIVGQNAKNTATYYALTNEHYGDDSESQRLLGLQITSLTNGEPSPTITLSKTTLARAVWEFQSDATTAFDKSFSIRSKQDNTYLGWGEYNLSTVAEPAACNIIQSNEANVYFLKMHGPMPAAEVGEYVFSSSGGRFSGNPATAKTYIYKVTAEAGEQLTLTRNIVPGLGGTYMFVTQNSKDQSTYYALTNEHYGDGANTQRLVGKQITTLGTDGLPAVTLNVNAADYATCLWTLEAPAKPEESEGSFFSAFMGSMRYYYNSIDTGDPTDSPKIVQALMVYVYPDRVVLSMKNYNQSGTFGSITVNKDLATYTSYRSVKLYDDPTNTLTGINKVDSFTLRQPQVYDLGGRLCKPSETLRPGVYVRDGVKFVK